MSDTLDVRTDELAEPVLDIDDVTERFNVTSKTIQRWRRKGLPARRFVFPDGKRRVGFLLGSVERFFAAHKDQVARGTNFSQVDDDERDEILRRARRLATLCRCCAGEITPADRADAQPLAADDPAHDPQARPGTPDQRDLPPRRAGPDRDEERTRIVRGYRRGADAAAARAAALPTAPAIYRVILEERLAKLKQRKVKFIDDPLYHQDDAAGRDRRRSRGQEELASADAAPEDSRVPRDLPPYLQELYRTPLLSPARERALFLKFNFHKFEFVTARRRLEPQFATARDLDELEAHLRCAVEAKNADRPREPAAGRQRRPQAPAAGAAR